MSSNKKTWCDFVHEALADEEKAQKFYMDMQDAIRNIQSPPLRELVQEITGMIHDQEATHEAMFRFLKESRCPYGSGEEQREEQARLRESREEE